MPSFSGPIPKLESQRRRTNKPDVPIVRASGSAAVEIPPADEHWHQLAQDWYESLAKSGQAVFLEPSDWAQARVWAHLLSVELMKDKPSPTMIDAWASGAGELLTTEGARRRLRIELVRATQADADDEHAEATVTALLARLEGRPS